ncbi:3-beta-hydroxysteroid dehydrogenase [Sporothrix brasiliensis 5110]|uniref:3-beta-hydroxysteroid dehydrogenase n=1 Tax=Sporothrix brasiliensis 5110 TaxID=1398154 RepID=A0A0C2IX94_9PEZI|nr:3-beta-hydroxysteroid dehydrogenase [Sporothrix brasiliensis 5110]KIH93736.1 3-beta-hydroxysteroid dehydrogenase [Sporothrix brasiliensis 5110]
MAETRVAIITGGASGIGLATATALGARKAGWEIHILDYNPAAVKAVDGVVGGVFHQVDVTDYKALGIVFRDIFRLHMRIDFVYANAGVGERADAFYDRSEASNRDEPPPLPKGTQTIIDVCLTAATTTAYLAQHYFRLSPESTRGERVLTFTASCGALYPSFSSPVYTATKHGVLGLMRCLDRVMWRRDAVRVNAVLPGTVKTNLLTAELWQQFPEEYFTPVAQIAKAVLVFLDNKDPARPDLDVIKGQAIECSGQNMHYRDPYPFCDPGMERVMAATDTGK